MEKDTPSILRKEVKETSTDRRFDSSDILKEGSSETKDPGQGRKIVTVETVCFSPSQQAQL